MKNHVQWMSQIKAINKNNNNNNNNSNNNKSFYNSLNMF